MGSSQSKPPSGEHVFSAGTPVRFSEGLVNSLQSSPETDTTRAKNQELLIQTRVTSELEKHRASSQSNLSSISESISTEPYRSSRTTSSHSGSTIGDNTQKSLLGRLGGWLTGDGQDKGSRRQRQDFNPDLDSTAVSKEVEDLKRKLDSRKRLVEADKEVEQAKAHVVACLKQNDQRPLDCWKEVEKFKAEVGRLERSFVEKNGS